MKLFIDWGIRPEIMVEAPPASIIGESKELSKELLKYIRNKKVLLFVGRLNKEKGFSLLLDAFEIIRSKRKDIVLLVAGEGPERREIKGVKYLGWVEKSKLGSAYRVADAFVIPTLVPEGHPAVVEDAFNYGLPVVATPVGALREMVGNRGILSESTSVEDMTKAILMAIKS